MILLIGMWISLTKNPMNPIMANPIAVAMAIFENSRREKRKHNKIDINLALYRLLQDKWKEYPNSIVKTLKFSA